MQVKLSPSEKIKVINSDDIYSVMQRILLRENKIDRNKEHFWIIGLSVTNKILYIELISLGTVTATLVEPMEVFSIALQKRSVNVMLIHNHPSGELNPSEADKDLTDRLQQIGLFLEVPVLDHLIITEKSYYSFADSGLLKELSYSKRYVLPYKEQERIKQEEREQGKKQGKEEKAKEYAQVLKNKGFSIEQIVELTGITTQVAKRLKATNEQTKKGRQAK
jgi:DNA repair protein RadC